MQRGEVKVITPEMFRVEEEKGVSPGLPDGAFLSASHLCRQTMSRAQAMAETPTSSCPAAMAPG